MPVKRTATLKVRRTTFSRRGWASMRRRKGAPTPHGAPPHWPPPHPKAIVIAYLGSKLHVKVEVCVDQCAAGIGAEHSEDTRRFGVDRAAAAYRPARRGRDRVVSIGQRLCEAHIYDAHGSARHPSNGPRAPAPEPVDDEEPTVPLAAPALSVAAHRVEQIEHVVLGCFLDGERTPREKIGDVVERRPGVEGHTRDVARTSSKPSARINRQLKQVSARHIDRAKRSCRRYRRSDERRGAYRH